MSVNTDFTVKESGHVDVRRVIVTLNEKGQEVRTYHRHVISPEDDLSREDPRIAEVARAARGTEPAALAAPAKLTLFARLQNWWSRQ